MTDRTPHLFVRDLSLSFAGLKALKDVTFSVPPASIFGLIGPNGAGKTTLLNCLTRIYTPNTGSIMFGETRVLDQPLHAMSSLGIARTFQNLELFGVETALDNVLIGALSNTPVSSIADLLGLPSARKALRDARERAHAALALMGIAEVADRTVATLAYGVQKRVELARALVTEPRLLLLDEPAAGLNPDETKALADVLRDLRDTKKITIILVEHDMSLVMNVCDELLVLDHGEVITQDVPAVVRKNPKVIMAYLGEEDSDAA
ncbi:MAG TPA: ABC transporter ATP-binding protein [Xanthobacteraceae bacterium]|nr:ABC transporter ATP-binding protein [Xanthobacteraceae bacterium]